VNSTFIDSHVILRFLLGDHLEQSMYATQLFEQAEQGELIISIEPMIVAECCTILSGSTYQFRKDIIVNHLVPVLVRNGVECDNLFVVLDALDLYVQYDVDFSQAYLVALSKATNRKMVSFDEDTRRMEAPLFN